MYHHNLHDQDAAHGEPTGGIHQPPANFSEAHASLAIVLALHRHKDTLDLDAFNLMKG